MMSEWYKSKVCGECACIPVCSIYSATGGVAQCKYRIDKREHEYMTKIKAPAAESIVMTMQCGKCMETGDVTFCSHKCPFCDHRGEAE